MYTHSEYARKFFWPAFVASGFSLRKTGFMLAQSYHENGGISSNSVASKTKNLFGIVCSNWNMERVKSCYQVISNSPTPGVVYNFRDYKSYSDSFRDWLDLMNSGNAGYKKAIESGTIREFADNISTSTYIPNDHNRPAYAAGVVSHYDKMRPYMYGYFALFIGLIIVLIVGVYYLYKYLAKQGTTISAPTFDAPLKLV
jgi:hypothetical protein